VSKKTTEIVEELLSGTVESLGYELADVEFIKEQGNWVLTLYIHHENGITLADCETVSRAVDPILDEADPISQAYYLSVSSLGLDRPIKKDKDFERNINKELTVKLYVPQDKKKDFVGKLIEFDGECFVLQLKNGDRKQIKRKDAALIKPYIDFKAITESKIEESDL